jgi:hypothetical protein
MPPPKPAINIPDIPEEGEWGSGLEHGYFSTHGELFDYAEPTADELAYFHMNDGQAQAIALAYALPILGAQGGIEEGPDDKGEAERIRDNLMRSQCDHADGPGHSPDDLSLPQQESLLREGHQVLR